MTCAFLITVEISWTRISLRSCENEGAIFALSTDKSKSQCLKVAQEIYVLRREKDGRKALIVPCCVHIKEKGAMVMGNCFMVANDCFSQIHGK